MVEADFESEQWAPEGPNHYCPLISWRLEIAKDGGIASVEDGVKGRAEL